MAAGCVQDRTTRSMLMDLLGDIGGSYARFALVEDGRFGLTFLAHRNQFPTLHKAIEFYLDAVRTASDGAVSVDVDRIALAWASPIVSGDIVQLGWLPLWKTLLPELKMTFGLSDLRVINDIAAIARAIPLMAEPDFRVLNAGQLLPTGNRVVIVPGTAFGAAFALWDGTKWTLMTTEAGFASAPLGIGDRERTILAAAQAQLGRVAISTFLSGPGLRYLYEIIGIVDGKLEPKTAKTALDIIESAVARDDPTAIETVDVFLSFFWRTVESMAFMFRATGGVYFSGILCRRLEPLLAATAASLPDLKRFPVSLILHEHPAFVGLQDLLANPADNS